MSTNLEEVFPEEPIVPKHEVLKNLHSKILSKGFNFHPGEILAAIDKEAKAQFANLCHEALNGISLSNLIATRDEVFEWMNKEDERFKAWKEERQRIDQLLASNPETILDNPVIDIKHETKVSSITKNKKK